MIREGVSLPAAGTEQRLSGDLVVPDGSVGVVLFAHGSGSSRLSSRNRWVADRLHEAGVGTLLMDLLTTEEEQVDVRTTRLRFDIELLTSRVLGAMDWLVDDARTRELPVGLFGASTGAAAALGAAAQRPEVARAVVSRGGRPDLAPDLGSVAAPVLLVVGGHDEQVIELNRQAARQLSAPHEIRIVQGATHLFEEPGALDEVAGQAGQWFRTHLAG